jgi:NAD(P)-dependent dehydrogenase (short-subunit alcohol dehydrogenase family)
MPQVLAGLASRGTRAIMMTTSPRRTALVTGGARGIGRAIVQVLERQNVDVVAPSRQELDLQSRESVEAFIARQRAVTIDILVNNAGINVIKTLESVDFGTWDTMVQVNLASAFRLIQAFAPSMAERGWGRILSVSTIFSLITKEGRVSYSMTKAALNALTRSAALEFGPRGVLVNALAPGYVDTALTRQNNTPEAIERICSTVPLRRLASVDELAEVAGFLVSEVNSYMTGQVVVVDGGFTLS